MRFPHPIPVSLLEFFRTGRFDCLELGETKEWIVHNFPDCDDRGANRGIWRYGTLELHFGGDVLDMIFCDYLHDLRAGPGIALDRWILDDPGACSLSRMMREFTHLGIDIAVRSRPELQRTEITVLDSDVRLGFHHPEGEDAGLSPNDWPISAFWRSRPRTDPASG